MTQIYELNNVLCNLDNQGGYFIDVVSKKSIQAGIMRLHEGENDTQGPHSVDEVYYVIEGSGFIKIKGKDHSIKQGAAIFVPAKTEHKFHGNRHDLIIFYVLGGK